MWIWTGAGRARVCVIAPGIEYCTAIGTGCVPAIFINTERGTGHCSEATTVGAVGARRVLTTDIWCTAVGLQA